MDSVGIKLLSDNHLLEKMQELAIEERELLLEILLHLKEIDERRLYLGTPFRKYDGIRSVLHPRLRRCSSSTYPLICLRRRALQPRRITALGASSYLRNGVLSLGYSSLFVYVTDKLHYSESAAYRRIEACRLLGKYDGVEESLKEGKVTLTTLLLIKPILTSENAAQVIEQVAYKSKLDVEKYVASSHGAPEIKDVMRRAEKKRVLGVRISTETATAVDHGNGSDSNHNEPVVEGDGETKTPHEHIKAPELRTRLAFTVGDEFLENLKKVQNILSHKYPVGQMEFVIGEALQEYAKRHSKGL